VYGTLVVHLSANCSSAYAHHMTSHDTMLEDSKIASAGDGKA
jgi:hypothetical protein